METFSRDLLDTLMSAAPRQAWDEIAQSLWQTFSVPLRLANAETEIVRRERAISDLENTLSGSCWDLWSAFESCVPRASQSVVDFWNRGPSGKAVLILDGVSLREAPWLLKQAEERGYTIHEAGPRGAELPCETSPFAKALGFSQRSALSNNGAGTGHKLVGAVTESTNLNWRDCAGLVGPHPQVVFWHHFVDDRLHDLAEPGRGLRPLTREVQEHFTSNDFWGFVERLATGRRLVITSDHGYAACEFFADLADKDHAEYMKRLFKSGRTAAADAAHGAWIPPIDLELATAHGAHRFVLGRHKWKSGGGYPTLHHGGLSLLEVFVPFLEISR
jgi:hypothetical protein